MEFQLTYRLPKEVIQAFHLTGDTGFETYFEDGVLYIRALPEEEAAGMSEHPSGCDGDCRECAFADDCPYDKAAEPGGDSEESDSLTREDPQSPDCRPEDCRDCTYYCRHCGRCMIDDREENRR